MEHARHVPLAVADVPFKNFPASHTAHLPLAVGDSPVRYCPAVQAGWAMHVKPSVVPLHEPLRYWPPGHVLLLHALQEDEFVVPLHTPAYLRTPQLLAPRAVQFSAVPGKRRRKTRAGEQAQREQAQREQAQRERGGRNRGRTGHSLSVWAGARKWRPLREGGGGRRGPGRRGRRGWRRPGRLSRCAARKCNRHGRDSHQAQARCCHAAPLPCSSSGGTRRKQNRAGGRRRPVKTGVK